MKLVTAFFAALIFFAGCSSQKELFKTPDAVSECRNEVKIKPEEYTGETIDKLNLEQSGKTITVSFQMKTLCNSKTGYYFHKTGNMVRIKLKNTDVSAADCACLKDVTILLNDALEAGEYTVLITNETGYQILAQQSGFIVK
jgi:hypothetical protein